MTAVALAAHTTMVAFGLQRYEPVGWAEELLHAATAADVAQLPRLYTAASFCAYTGRPEVAVTYADTTAMLETDLRYQPFDIGWASIVKANAHLFAGRIDRFVEIRTDLATLQGTARVAGLCGLTFGLPAVGRAGEAAAIADETLNAARAQGNPFYVAFALAGYARALTGIDSVRALHTYHEGLAYAREHRLAYWEAIIARTAAPLEVVHGDPEAGLVLFDTP